jgi:hypothetical protein
MTTTIRGAFGDRPPAVSMTARRVVTADDPLQFVRPPHPLKTVAATVGDVKRELPTTELP